MDILPPQDSNLYRQYSKYNKGLYPYVDNFEKNNLMYTTYMVHAVSSHVDMIWFDDLMVEKSFSYFLFPKKEYRVGMFALIFSYSERSRFMNWNQH